MKKFYLFALLAATAVTALSCNKEETVPAGRKTITVELGCSPATRTDLVSGNHVYWSKNDKNIWCITDAGSFNKLTSTEGTQKASKTFTGTIPSGETPLFYFYDANRTSRGTISWKGNGLIRHLLEKAQTCGNDTFNNTYSYAIAKADERVMRNLMGYFKWTNNGNAIRSVKFETVTAGEYLAGYFDVTYDSSEPYCRKYNYNNMSETAGAVDVTTTVGATTIPSGKSYYAIILPGTYHGLKATVTLGSGTSFVLKTDETVVVERGKYIDFGVMPKAAVENVVGSLTFTTGQDFEAGWNMNF